MINTYLALLRNGDGVKEEDRELILQTLFRPATSGYIKDDTSISIHEHFSKMMAK